jgi:predicted O-methyltransferase YrrM
MSGWTPQAGPIGRALRAARRSVSNRLTRRLFYRWRYGPPGLCLSAWHPIPGWTTREEAAALARESYALGDGATVVEVGSFLGKSSVVLAGARRLRGSGVLHCIDPFDGSGDAHSVSSYRTLARQSPLGLRARFEANIREAGLSDWVVIHAGTAEAVGGAWTAPIDMLFMDGDQSPAGVRAAFDAFAPHLKPGAILALHNSADRTYADTHDGHRRLVVEAIRAPEWTAVYQVESTTFARKAR